MTDFAFRRISGHTYSLSWCQLVAVEQYAMRPSAKLHDEATMLCPRAATTCHPLVLTLLASAVVQQVFHIVSATVPAKISHRCMSAGTEQVIACPLCRGLTSLRWAPAESYCMGSDPTTIARLHSTLQCIVQDSNTV